MQRQPLHTRDGHQSVSVGTQKAYADLINDNLNNIHIPLFSISSQSSAVSVFLIAARPYAESSPSYSLIAGSWRRGFWATGTVPRVASYTYFETDATTDRPLPTFALIPSAPRLTALIPSAPTSQVAGLIPSQRPGLIPSQPLSGLIPSQPPSSTLALIPSSPPPGIIPSSPQPSGLIPSAPVPSDPGAIPSTIESPIPTSGTLLSSIPNVGTTIAIPSMTSTEEGLHPIPAQTTSTGDPNGHHEIPEPNFSVTVPCRGCSPVIEITATGWGDFPSQPAADHAETTQRPPAATITAGPSQIVVTREPSGGGFVIGSSTVKPGQVVTVDNTPIAVQTSAGHTEVVVGTKTVPFVTAPLAPNQITDAPSLLPITVGTQTLTPIANPNNQNPSNQNSDSNPSSPQQYVVGGQTVTAGGTPITVDGTTISLLPSATAVVINGQTSTLSPAYGAIYTTTDAPVLTLNGHTYTANRAGYYIIAAGTTIIPGGPPITVNGTAVSLEPHGTVAVIAGSTSLMQPVTTIVTLTRSGAGGYGGNMAYSTGAPGSLPYPTGKSQSGGMSVRVGFVGAEGWLEGVVFLGMLCAGWLAVWL